MDGQSSSTTAPHFVLSDLLRIQDPTCEVAAEIASLESDRSQTAHLYHQLEANVSGINSSLENLSIFGHDLRRHLQPLLDQATEGNIRPENVCDLIEGPHFTELIRAVKQFKLQLPFTSYYDLRNENPRPLSTDRNHEESAIPAILSSEYGNLPDNEKKCLFCCSAFDSEIKKRVLINWWIGENLLHDSNANSDGETQISLVQAGEDLLKRFLQKKFIHRVETNKKATDALRMEQPVRLFLRSKAKDDKFFDFSEMVISEEVMLLKSDNQIDPLLDRSTGNKVKTVFNVDRFLVVEKEAKILSMMKYLRVLHLGRCTLTQKQSVRVKNLNLILKRLNKMKQLRLLSLHGISSITKLPDLVCELKHLMVLDLGACQALESLPSSIGNLKSLIYLDMSGCHILMPLPKELSLLVNLEVLKGFVVGTESTGTSKICTLNDLGMLKKLHKLSIYVLSTNFPQHEDLKALSKIVGLVNLKLVWNPTALQVKQENVHSDKSVQCHGSGDVSQNGRDQENDNIVQIDQAMDITVQGNTIQGPDNAVPESTRLVRNEPVLQHGNQALNSPAEASRRWSPTMLTCCFRTHMEDDNSTEVLQNLEKLDLWYVPEEAAQILLAPKNFTNALKKLYVRWAKIQHLNYNNETEVKWDVSMLRLLFLPNLQMSWEELKDGLFPELSYLELKDCSKLQFSQYCDDAGVWIDPRLLEI